jgi:hypothetical protein
MTIRNVEDMVYAYHTSKALRESIDSIMANEAEYVMLAGNGSYASSAIMSPPEFKAQSFCFKGFRGLKV